MSEVCREARPLSSQWDGASGAAGAGPGAANSPASACACRCWLARRCVNSASVTSARAPNSTGRSNGTVLREPLGHTPCKSGSPHGVRNPPCAPAAAAAAATITAITRRRICKESIIPVGPSWKMPDDPEVLWARAAEQLPWFRSWDRVFEWTAPTFRWFIGAETNIAVNALDHHVAAGRGDHPALIYLNERGERRTFTYAQLLDQVTRAAAALRGLGIGRGDRLTIYMPTCPEAIILMLATVRIGAIHSVVFAGFGARALGERIKASGSKAVFTSDVTWRKGKDLDLLSIVEDALEMFGDGVEHLVVFERQGASTWEAFLERGTGQSGAHERMEANEPAFILATSGTTATPKLAVHTHGGYQVHIAAMGRWCFGLTPDDVWWATSDIGWIVGHSYMVYAPLLAGCTTVAFEGALDYPRPDTHWRTVVEELGATGIFTSPTAIRMLMRYGDATLSHVDHSRLQRIVCAGEVLNPQAWEWLQNRVLGGRVPVIDHMWQTETGGPVFGNPYGIEMLPIKPGSAALPLPGIDAAVVTLEGQPCGRDEKGIMVLRRPFPGMTPGLW